MLGRGNTPHVGIPEKAVHEQIELLGEHVLPLLRAEGATATT
jgi:hypothetical protein